MFWNYLLSKKRNMRRSCRATRSRWFECSGLCNSCSRSFLFKHAGLGDRQRDQILDQWTRGEVSIICGTVAVGMGIDKANVRFVVHFQVRRYLFVVDKRFPRLW